MVQQDVIDYIRIGKERGYSVDLLRTKLLDSGFTLSEINEAVAIVEKQTPIKADKPASLPTGKEYFTNAGSVNGKPNSAMKTGSIAGFIIAGLLVFVTIAAFMMRESLTFAAITSPPAGFVENLDLAIAILTSIPIIVLIILGLFYFRGFAQIGKAFQSKVLRFSSWSVFFTATLSAIATIAFAFLLSSQWSALQGVAGSLSTDAAGLLGKGLAYVSIVAMIASLGFISLMIFSLTLIFSKDIPQARISGAFYLLTSLSGLFSSGIIAMVFLYPGPIIMGNLSSGMTGLIDLVMNSYFMLAERLIAAISFVFGSLVLMKSSRKFT
jgi:hypothetical protein